MKSYIILLSLFLNTQLVILYAQNPVTTPPAAPTMPKPAITETKLPEIKEPVMPKSPVSAPVVPPAPKTQPQNPPVVIPPSETKMAEPTTVEKKMETKKEEAVIPADIPVIPTLPEAPKPEKIETKKSMKESEKESDLALFKDEFNRADEALSRFFAYSQEFIAKNPEYRDQILDPLGQLFGKMIAALEVISGEKFIDEEALKEELERQEALALQAEQKAETEEMEGPSQEPESPVVIGQETEAPEIKSEMKPEMKKREPETKEEFRATRQLEEPTIKERLKPVGEVKTIAPEM